MIDICIVSFSIKMQFVPFNICNVLYSSDFNLLLCSLSVTTVGL